MTTPNPFAFQLLKFCPFLLFSLSLEIYTKKKKKKKKLFVILVTEAKWKRKQTCVLAIITKKSFFKLNYQFHMP